jgi:CubicO group peptidase (beta-lactamase class C family)
VIAAVEDALAADLEQFAVPGASWAVIDGGEIVHEAGIGSITAGRRDSVSPATLFQACSISKPVAALAMLRLVDRGVLDLDEDVNDKLTSWRIPPLESWQPVVTLRQLVSHSAGLTTSGFPGYRAGAALPTTVEILDGVEPANTFAVRVDTVPGLQFRYSGGGTMVMQQLLEDVTGTPLRALVRELVLEPLGMDDSDYAQPLPEELHDRAATAHDEAGRPIDGRWHTYPELAAAGLWTTPGDLARFAIGIQQTCAGADDALLSPALARELLAPQIDAGDRIGGLNQLGLGPFVGGAGQARRFGHQGGNVGFRCHLLAYRNTGQGAVVMTNGENGNWVVERAFARIAAAYGWPDYATEERERNVPDGPVLASFAGTYELHGRPLTVEPDGGNLLVGFPGQAPIEFVPQSDDSFAGWIDTGIRFDLSGDAPVLVVSQNGAEIACPRAEA